jgi:cytochrome oxidase Cu insertion factor (SCO1/SenC/PrrC family)
VPLTPKRWWLRRWALFGLAAAFAALVAAGCSTSGTDADLSPGFNGTTLNPPQRAADFTFTDQFGDEVSLSEHRGSVVILTFLYTYCPDVCPVVASHLTDVHELLSSRADGGDAVTIIAVSVDPERDTVERAHEYSRQYGMLDEWTYLVGGEEELSETWADYYVAPAPLVADSLDADPLDEIRDEIGDDKGAGDGSADSLAEQIAATYTVNHQTPVYLIDRDGMMRALFTLPFDPEDVVADVRTLLD